MMDANARFAVCKKMKQLNMNPKDFLGKINKFENMYKEEITNTYVQNARWSIELGEEFFKQNKEAADYVVFVYNYENRRREYWKLIKKAIENVGSEVIERLGKHADIYAFGIDKKYWKKRFPEIRELKKPRRGEKRAIFGFGFQQGRAYDKTVEYVRKIDFFIRASQLRLSGMYFPALDNSLFVLLTHPPSLYNASRLVKSILETKREDVKHDKYNIYNDPKIYEEWKDFMETAPTAIISSISRIPKIVSFG